MISTRFTKQAKIELPIICGAMYPCSNPELVAAASEAGGIGIVQPLSLTYVHGHDFREGLRFIRSLTNKPYGVNIIVEQSSKTYENKMKKMLDIAIEEGCRFFITALGNPRWVVNQVKPYGGIVYHDVVNRKWALKGLEGGVDGFICVNNRAGGHAGVQSIEALYVSLKDLNIPLIATGGIGDENDVAYALKLGYDGVQLGTRFIATKECHESEAYKQAILNAKEEDIVLTERVTGIPLSVINTPYVQQMGTKAGPLARWMLQNRYTKRFMRFLYGIIALRDFKKISRGEGSSKNYWQAGKSCAHIQKVESVSEIMQRFAKAIHKNF
ncbi:MAG: NAD(P)H-dependent flavin oxidoreductase [Parachlamydiaceae bacterium]